MDESTKILGAVFQVLRDFYAIPEGKLSPNVLINRDLGIDGDDAAEFISFLEEKVGRQINITLSDYFYGEGLIQFGKRKDLSAAELQRIISNNSLF